MHVWDFCTPNCHNRRSPEHTHQLVVFQINTHTLTHAPFSLPVVIKYKDIKLINSLISHTHTQKERGKRERGSSKRTGQVQPFNLRNNLIMLNQAYGLCLPLSPSVCIWQCVCVCACVCSSYFSNWLRWRDWNLWQNHLFLCLLCFLLMKLLSLSLSLCVCRSLLMSGGLSSTMRHLSRLEKLWGSCPHVTFAHMHA